MRIVITKISDNSAEEFTSCTGLSTANGLITFTGTDSGGEAWTYTFPLSHYTEKHQGGVGG